MNRSLEFKIKKRSLFEWASFLIFFLPFVYSFITELIGIPSVIRFASDFLILFLMGIIITNSLGEKKVLITKSTAPLFGLVAVFLVYTFAVFFLRFQSPFYYVWGVRNNFRFFAAFFIFVFFMNKDEVEEDFKLLDVLFWIHFAITLIQYFIFDYKQDNLGGIFGVEKGCNGYVIIFLCIITMRSILSFMNGKERASVCFSKCIAVLLVAVLAELKVFFVIFILVLILSSIVTSFSVKKTVLLVVSGLLIMITYMALVTLYEHFDGFLSFESLLTELTKENYASDEDLGRFTAIPAICDRFLKEPMDQLLGMGMGNCDTSTISFFNTDFYNTYVDIHYSTLSVAFMFLETGFIGLFLYTMFFVICFVYSVISFKKKRGNMFFNQMGIIMSLLCFLLIFYNSSLRTEAGYMVYFVLALPFIGMKGQNKPQDASPQER